MPKHTVQQRTLNAALASAGDLSALAHALRVPADQLTRWLSGAELPPTWVFLKTVDYINERDADLPKPI